MGEQLKKLFSNPVLRLVLIGVSGFLLGVVIWQLESHLRLTVISVLLAPLVVLRGRALLQRQGDPSKNFDWLLLIAFILSVVFWGTYTFWAIEAWFKIFSAGS